MNRQAFTEINKAARRASGCRLITCTVGEHWTPNGGTTFDYDSETVDLADNGMPLKNFLMDIGRDFTGTLDVFVYSYRSPRDLAEGYVELETNVYAKFIDGKMISVND